MTETAARTATAVRGGELDPVSVTERALDRIAAADGILGSFRHVRAEEAVAEARALVRRPDLADLPLAGVPVAVKDVTAIEGEYASWGSRATSRAPATADGDVPARLRAAGAVVVGITRVPELCVWPMSDSPYGVARNPWEPSYAAGGSSGGSAAAVAGGLVPVAHGTDGLGSVRLPAAMCGLVGVKPGRGVIPETGSPGWFGMSTHGSMATTVEDAALLLGVLADRPELGRVREPGPLRLAVSTQVPLTHAPVPAPLRAAAERVGELLGGAGHHVERATPRYGVAPVLGILTRWFAGPHEQAEHYDRALLQRRTRAHLRVGGALRRAGVVRDETAERWQAVAAEFFAEHDVLITPALATLPPKAGPWNERSWPSNAVRAVRVAGFAGLWNLAGYPAMSVPAGRHPSGLPVGVQLVAAPGGEARLLGLAAQLEGLAPWPRTPTG
ncbi:amidase [Amycolatopsis antarctica]|uniref:Amidase n=1 Tax=Amycolatopsis antarctica TaxID=1854586 RepID=A0A263D5E7_9PSEU|nr:amidase family protein [Amycolatopsis antarctica]OZM73601.1 amidase [Amycolatopsis antarctica]